MYFAAHCLDRPGSVDLRLATRARHLKYIDGLGDKVALAGPYLNEAGAPVGSLLIFKAETRAEVETMLSNDPYNRVDLFDSVEIRPWAWVIHPPREG